MSTPTGGNDDQAVRVFLTVIAKLSSAATELADQADGNRATEKMFGTCQKLIDVVTSKVMKHPVSQAEMERGVSWPAASEKNRGLDWCTGTKPRCRHPMSRPV